jgi:hypothetical protein
VTDPITPSPELVTKWILESDIPSEDMYEGIATRAAQWGADQELEACCNWVAVESIAAATELRSWRRPKPPSLKEQALALLQPGEPRLFNSEMQDTLRRALEALPE